MAQKTLLMILDGWGNSPDPTISAVDQARTPYIDSLYENYANSTLRTDGEHVGLPEGQMGNSEVGHMNLGAGRVVYQNLVRINKAVKENTLGQEVELAKAFDYASQNNKSVHFIGLVSDGGVHAHIEHLKSLLTSASEAGLKKVFVHAFTDGRDTDPKSGLHFLTDLYQHTLKTNTQIATVTGRYFAMDRDNRWDRVEQAYQLLVEGQGQFSATTAMEGLNAAYERGESDEFVKATRIGEAAKMEDGDAVVFMNFRADRARELTRAFVEPGFDAFARPRVPQLAEFVMLTQYAASIPAPSAYKPEALTNVLGEYLANNGKTQLRIAETEKYAHVTFFFSGGREALFEGQQNILRNSPKVATYDLQPEMSAADLRDALIPELEKEEVDFVCLNFANPDMVGHTGVFSAVVKAVETVDACAEAVVTAGLAHGYSFIIIADHGNADVMMNEDGSPNTAHSTNLVPCILVDNDFKPTLRDGKLGDVSPTILKLMGVAQPKEMTGEALF